MQIRGRREPYRLPTRAAYRRARLADGPCNGLVRRISPEKRTLIAMAKPLYAAATEVTPAKSRAEIETLLGRYGADAFGYVTEPGRAAVVFRINGRQIRFKLNLPDPGARQFTHNSRGARTVEAAARAYEQACRQCWRALALVIKAKLEAVAAGIVTMEDEFLAQTILPDGSTVAEWTGPQLTAAYQTGSMPTRLLIEGPR